MNIGQTIKALRLGKGLTQEQLADRLSVSVQTISRWETAVNYPDVLMVPTLAAFFAVSADFLLGIKGEPNMAKLLRTIGYLEFDSMEAAEEMVRKFSSEKFPILKSHNISEQNGAFVLEVAKEFNMDLDKMKFGDS